MSNKKEKTKRNINGKNLIPKDRTRNRSIGLCLVFVLLLICLLVRIAFIQIVHGSEYSKIINLQQTDKNNKIIQAIRGSMTDRNGYSLVFSKRVYNVIFDPSNMTNMDQEELVKLKDIMKQKLDVSAEEVDKALIQNTRKYIIMKKAISKELKEELSETFSEQKIPGITFEEDFKREYLGNTFACHLIGFATNGTGRWGLEYEYDKYLKGTAGREYVTFEDNIPSNQTIAAKDGANLVLTIDKNIQTYVEDALKKNIEEQFDPLKASIIVMNPSTGEVLAMACYPYFDLNNPNDISSEYYQHIFDKFQKADQIAKTYNKETGTYDDQLITINESDKLSLLHKNVAITDTIEPGSIFKPLLVAAAFEEGIITENSTFTCNGGLQVADKYIGCMGHHGTLNAKQVLQKSCNVGVMEIAQKLKRKKFYAYQKSYGIGEKTGIDLPGEASGATLMYSVEKLNDTELATSSFGQSFQVTPLQMITAFCSVINGGKLMRPYVVSEVVDSQGATLYQNSPLEIRRVISDEVSNLMKSYLKSCVDDGLAKGIQIDGYAIGGKTGTSEKLPRELGKVVTSFVSFAPVNDPKIALIVSVDDPVGETLFGSTVAGKTSKEILEKVLQYLGVPKSNFTYSTDSINTKVTVGTYTNYSLVEAINMIQNSNLTYKINGEGTSITSQSPAPGTKLSYNGSVTLNVSSTTGQLITMPNLIGQTYEDACKQITTSGLKVVYDDTLKDKIVNKQVPLQGVKLDKGTTVIVNAN